ncbi:hypothetical protein GMORB2_4367 [Geosmithia morbida]|uniref:Uncharacterized protein n=1 Tax=Geosmithia morbida TaxID=1094350 RepID=A0A9P4Z170_9HYPO|nr:uncharacterized protein GMORB2_4367 [Geosmithia morbida]KAF4125527.1 hypothetical protein GMORB2_4367 [Geosmithia morbida]
MEIESKIPGLNLDLTERDLEQSQQIYNSLPTDENQLDIGPALEGLAKIFVKHNVHESFGVHLAHAHFKIGENTIFAGDGSLPCWTKPTETDSLDLENIYGHKFVLADGRFHPYEYRAGIRPRSLHISDFVSELADFIQQNGLKDAVALEVLDKPLPRPLMELVVGDHGTMMAPSEKLIDCTPFRQTGWTFTKKDGKPNVCKDGQQFHGAHPRGHVIVTTSWDVLESKSDVVHFLEKRGLYK